MMHRFLQENLKVEHILSWVPRLVEGWALFMRERVVSERWAAAQLTALFSQTARSAQEFYAADRSAARSAQYFFDKFISPRASTQPGQMKLLGKWSLPVFYRNLGKRKYFFFWKWWWIRQVISFYFRHKSC